MVELKRLTETPGNCFSCGYLEEFIPQPRGIFKCGWYNEEYLNDTNNPMREDCSHWKQKTSQEVLSVNGQFAGIKNK